MIWFDLQFKRIIHDGLWRIQGDRQGTRKVMQGLGYDSDLDLGG